MTLKTFCDRCDKNTESKHARLVIDIYPRRKGKDGFYTQTSDLCPTCFEHFQKFMKQYNKK
jgi:hypothetical protein